MMAFKSNRVKKEAALGQGHGASPDDQSQDLSGSGSDDEDDDYYDENREKIESIQTDMRELNGKVNYMMKVLEQLANHA